MHPLLEIDRWKCTRCTCTAAAKLEEEPVTKEKVPMTKMSSYDHESDAFGHKYGSLYVLVKA